MRRVILLLLCALPLFAQPRPQRITRQINHAMQAEMAVKNAAELLANDRKDIERDVQVLQHLQKADAALTDDMQPSAAVEKAWEGVQEAKRLQPDFLVMQGVMRMEQELSSARRSPGSADFGRLRSLLRSEALAPASRVASQNALRLEEEVLAWIKVQELISTQLRALSELAGDSMRAAQK
ncbi:MAG: hypothetical protein ACLGH0_05045 [Thermoanaerobaculia bacterium]